MIIPNIWENIFFPNHQPGFVEACLNGCDAGCMFSTMTDLGYFTANLIKKGTFYETIDKDVGQQNVYNTSTCPKYFNLCGLLCVSCCGWLRNPAPVDRWFITLYHPFRGARFCNRPQYPTMWGPLVISWFINPRNYSCKYHKP